jgi:erythromycin esterase
MSLSPYKIMKFKYRYLLLIIAPLLQNCKGNEPLALLPPVEQASKVTEAISQEMERLTNSPEAWGDGELKFLDDVADKSVIGLGEATHGSKEFFLSKYRVFRYLAENHGFKIFAIEADMGESMFINEAVMKSDKSQIETLMKEKMIFWTWRNQEVRDMLYWMCDYNVGKADEDKVQYWGIDCQFNTYHGEQLKEHLQEYDLSFYPFAGETLDEATRVTNSYFKNYTSDSYNAYLKRVTALRDSIILYRNLITQKGTQKRYEMVLQLANEIIYVSEVVYHAANKLTQTNYRDEYMAKNILWLRDYFDGAKVFVWAHNWHVGRHPAGTSFGYVLDEELGNEYTNIGFLFSKGQFRALTQSTDQVWPLDVQSLETDPLPGSLNEAMSKTAVPVFTIKMDRLNKYPEWNQALTKGIVYFDIGAVFNHIASNYYGKYEASFFDRIIYFDRSLAATPLQ